MSGPNANLKKGKRTPLPGLGKRQAPFRNSSSLSITDKILDDVLRSPSQQSSKSDSSVLRGRPHLPKLDGQRQDAASAPSDFDLMNGMMNKIAKLELQVQLYAKEVIEKDKKIGILQEKVKLKEKYSSMGHQENNAQKLKELETKCVELQNQIKEMEDFLADYGMVFVGSSHSQVAGVYEELADVRENVWRPDLSIAGSTNFHVDFDKIVKNVRELNVLGGEGEKKVQHTVKGAKLTTKESIPLTIYANGIFMFNGPFRSFENQETQQCVQDLMDGFFPSELQKKYPDGVPIELNDQRDTLFEDSRSREHFPGIGQLLGGENTPSRIVPSNLDKTTNTDVTNEGKGMKTFHQTSRPPGIQMSMEQFLNKLPPSVLKDGKVIDIRSSVASNLMDKAQHTSVTETPVVANTKCQINQDGRASSDQSMIATLRVKSETGDQTFIIKMKYEDTIQDLRDQLDRIRSASAPAYELVTSFPYQVYQNLDMTLDECGLTPNATLHMNTK
ncbi:putative UBX domain-containing protein 11 [Apostichopus japonicus]|uniref:UBX domain-containing protein 11 n=1 Tax=Stichopus japonicus TaxID=307972 RepID=A0A2G8KU47_STIJA|nr:putative UBX domain-containing protein 11 [Apostichopus japonicus]